MEIDARVRQFVRDYFQVEVSDEENIADPNFAPLVEEDETILFLDEFMSEFEIRCDRFDFFRNGKRSAFNVLLFFVWRARNYPSIELIDLTTIDLIAMAKAKELTEKMISKIEGRSLQGLGFERDIVEKAASEAWQSWNLKELWDRLSDKRRRRPTEIVMWALVDVVIVVLTTSIYLVISGDLPLLEYEWRSGFRDTHDLSDYILVLVQSALFSATCLIWPNSMTPYKTKKVRFSVAAILGLLSLYPNAYLTFVSIVLLTGTTL